jgi:hypothetical protein
LVPPGQASAFCEKAKQFGVNCAIHIIPQAKHGLWDETEMVRFETQWSDIFDRWIRAAISVH